MSLSVLLIIGAAVVGPIEAQPVRGVDHPAYRACLDAHPFLGPLFAEQERTRGMSYYGPTEVAQYGAFPCGNVRESLLELCERAMREIGAQVRMHGIAVQGPNGELLTSAPSPVWRLGVAEVRCIPTPEGYRK